MKKNRYFLKDCSNYSPLGVRGIVRVEGLEPPCLAAPDPKSGMSTNFTTPAITNKQSNGSYKSVTISNLTYLTYLTDMTIK